ncbi:MAG TPA: DEAD/DEAH box helicase, partial [Bacteroidia bacterium]|nr:DEAD/DEAH box helicase [Bacteroidia bacterium]
NVFSDYTIYNPETDKTYKVAIRSKHEKINFCNCLDFKTNGLGTCKHIEYIKQHIESRAINRQVFESNYIPPYSSVYLEYSEERKIKFRIGTENKEEFEKLTKNYFDKNYELKESGYKQFDVFLKEAKKIQNDFRCYDDALSFIIEKREVDKRKSGLEKILKKNPDFYNTLLKVKLLPYQNHGVTFAVNAGRSLIADDMGLGKTLQAIATAEVMKNLSGIKTVLVICPTSLKYQWKSEIEKFTNSTITIVEGNLLQRELIYKNDTSFYKIVSYNAAIRDVAFINKMQFDLLILDEAQRIKNWQTVTAKSIKNIQTKYCVVLTGTPLENKLEELYSIIQMIDPLKLGAMFRFVYQHQIKADDGTQKVIGYKDLHKVAEILKHNMVRRHKRDVLSDLPSRIDKNLLVPMTEKQLEFYREYEDTVAKLVNKWIRNKFLSEGDRQKLLINLNLMRMVCDSTFIIDQQTRHDTKIEELMNILDEVFEAGDEKVVVFSQWERMTRLVAQELDARNIQYENLNGNVPSKDREKLLSNFRENPHSRVFLSTDAGGVGLNLQSASLLINLDLPWNPAVLEQRIGRIHRMGQKNNVQIINIISANTIEHQMLTKLKFKSSMAAGVLDNGDSTVFLGDSKFTELMKDLQHIVDVKAMPDVTNDNETEKKILDTTPEEKNEAKEFINQLENETEQVITKEVAQLTLFNEQELEAPQTDVVKQGVTFFENLMATIADEKKTESLINQLIKTDEKTGETSIVIPIKNKEVMQNGFKLLMQLFKR